MLPQGRYSGVLLPVFSLRSRSDWGMGDFGALDGLFAWLGAANQRILMLLPLLPLGPNDSSPYATRGAFGLNPLLVDLSQIPEHDESALSDDERRERDEVRAAPRVQYGRVRPLKRAALQRAFARFEEQKSGERTRAFEAWCESQREWLDNFTLFSALGEEQQHKPWWDWAPPLAQRAKEALEQARARLARPIRYEAWKQWVCDQQWAQVRKQASARKVLLCGDEPFIIAQNSADAWAFPHLLRRDARLGVPPDDFSADGQDWGLPYFDFQAMEQEGYTWLKSRARRAAGYYDLRRIDHAIGYFRQFIRDEATPRGRFVPADEASQRALGLRHFELLSAGTGIVAEDLGVIPDFARQVLDQLGLPGYRVMRWERRDGAYRDPRRFPALSLTCTGTHDTEPLAVWWEAAQHWEREAMARAVVELQALNPLPHHWTPELHQALVIASLASSSNLCVNPWQDVLGTRDRINTPGSVGAENWSYRMDQSTDALLTTQRTREAAEWYGRLTAEAGRA